RPRAARARSSCCCARRDAWHATLSRLPHAAHTTVTPSAHHCVMQTLTGPQDAPQDARRRRWLLGAGALALGACASTPPDADEPVRLAQSPWARATTLDGVSASGP